MIHRSFTLVILLTLVLAGPAGCGKKDRADGELIIFHAGSLTVPFQQLAELFESQHPGIRVKAEAAGSRQCARKISDLDRECDVMASADYRVVENLLIPEYTAFNIRFAANEMVIAYTDGSKGSETITLDNWHEVLRRVGVEVGRSDANSDPCGYRALMVFQLAEAYYDLPGLAAMLDEQCRLIRPKETDLLALLELGELDYLVIYRSIAQQHGLRMITLPDEVNLKSQALAALYRSAEVEVTGKQPGTRITRVGEPIMYSVTIPHNAANAEAAEAFVQLLLSPAGRAIMEKNGQSCFRPAVVGDYAAVPPSIQPMCIPAADELSGTDEHAPTTAPMQR